MAMKRDKYCLLITFKCDWDCSYCIVDTHNQPEPTHYQIFDMIDNIKDHSTVSIAGGEPGMARRELIVEILDRLEKKNCDIQMDTNGLFIKRYPDLVSRISYFFYHCSDTLENKDIYRPKLNNPMDYVIIADDENFKLVKPFLEYNKDLNIHVHKARVPQKDHRTSLSTKNALFLYNEIKHLIAKESIMHLIGDNSSINKDVNIIGLRQWSQ